MLSIYEKEKPEGVIVQFGGQTPLNLAGELAEAGVKILGTSPDTIDLAEDRDRFRQVMRKLGIPQPESGMASTLDEALAIAERDRLSADGAAVVRAGRPGDGGGPRRGDAAAVRGGGRGRFARAAHPDRPLPGERHRGRGRRLADGEDAFVPAVMEHIELAGIHSGDSACVIPPISIPPKHIDTIYQYNRKIAIELKVVGLMNIQYAIHKDTVYILEANPRASRTVPLVSKVCNIPMARIATQIMLGKKLSELGLGRKSIPALRRQGGRVPLQHVPRGRSAAGARDALHRRGAGHGRFVRPGVLQGPGGRPAALPLEGTVLITVADRDKPAVVEVARRFAELGFRIKATEGTRTLPGGGRHRVRADPEDARGPAQYRRRHHDGEIQLVINTPRGKVSKADDAYIRQTAIKRKVPYITTLAAAWPPPRASPPTAKATGRSRACRSITPISGEGGAVAGRTRGRMTP